MKEAAEVARGQRLAIITGAVSIVFGVRQRLKPPPPPLVPGGPIIAFVQLARGEGLHHHSIRPDADISCVQVLYLVGVQVLGSREMLPPPPEALL